MEKFRNIPIGGYVNSKRIDAYDLQSIFEKARLFTPVSTLKNLASRHLIENYRG